MLLEAKPNTSTYVVRERREMSLLGPYMKTTIVRGPLVYEYSYVVCSQSWALVQLHSITI
jgi:hypothetical protein